MSSPAFPLPAVPLPFDPHVSFRFQLCLSCLSTPYQSARIPVGPVLSVSGPSYPGLSSHTAALGSNPQRSPSIESYSFQPLQSQRHLSAALASNPFQPLRFFPFQCSCVDSDSLQPIPTTPFRTRSYPFEFVPAVLLTRRFQFYRLVASRLETVTLRFTRFRPFLYGPFRYPSSFVSIRFRITRRSQPLEPLQSFRLTRHASYPLVLILSDDSRPSRFTPAAPLQANPCCS